MQQVDLNAAGLLGEFLTGIGFFFQACRARSSATVKLPEEPRPVPAGMSDMLTISRYGRGPTSAMRKASRTIGCFT